MPASKDRQADSLAAEGLRGSNVSCLRGERLLFRALDFSLAPGQWLHVRGANGSGKTSLLRILAGLSPPASGEITWGGQAIHAHAAEYRRQMRYSGHLPALKEDLSARENVRAAVAFACGVCPGSDQINGALARLGLTPYADLPVRFLSAGQKRRVGLARLIASPAPLWILDEPFTALDVDAVSVLQQLIQTHLAQQGMAVLTSHQDIALPEGQVLPL